MNKSILSYLDYCENVLCRSENVIQHHKYSLLKRAKFLNEKWKTKPEQIWFNDCMEYIQLYKSTPIENWPNMWELPKHNTIVEHVKSIRGFMWYMGLLGRTTWSIDLFPAMKKQRGFRDMCYDDEYEALSRGFIETADKFVIGVRNNLLVDIAYHTGLRRNELLRLRFSDFESPYFQFEIKRKFWYIDPVVFDKRLQNKVRLYRLLLDVFLSNRCKNIDNDYLFIGLDNKNFGKVLRDKYLDVIMSSTCDVLISQGKLKRRIHLHMLRHSFATNCVYAWLSQQAVSTLMGHRSMSSTLRYFNLSNQYIQKEYQKVMQFLEK